MNKDTSITQGDVFLSDNEVGGDDFEDGGCPLKNDDGSCISFNDCCYQKAFGTVKGSVNVTVHLLYYSITVSWEGDVTVVQDCGTCVTPNLVLIPSPEGLGGSGFASMSFLFSLWIVAAANCGPCDERDYEVYTTRCPKMSWKKNVSGRHSFTIEKSKDTRTFIKRVSGTGFNPHILFNPLDDPASGGIPDSVREVLDAASDAISVDIGNDIGLCQ